MNANRNKETRRQGDKETRRQKIHRWFCLLVSLSPCLLVSPVQGGDLIVDVGPADGITFVGVLKRWDAGGSPRVPINPKAKIDDPEVFARGDKQEDQRWLFRKLPAGRYDLVVLMAGRVRVEGFSYPPVRKSDGFLSPRDQAPEEARDWIVKDIARSKHYENKVTPLYLAGDEKQVRILVQLVRDKGTSYDAEFGAPVATVRHEVWQYTNYSGGWAKERTTRVLDRLLLARSEFQRWTWVWEPQLGGIEVDEKPVTVAWKRPKEFDRQKARGWFPD